MGRSVCAPGPERKSTFWASLPPLPHAPELLAPGCFCESHLRFVARQCEAQLSCYLWLEGSVPSGLHGYEGSPCSNPRSLRSRNVSCWCRCEQASRGTVSTR